MPDRARDFHIRIRHHHRILDANASNACPLADNHTRTHLTVDRALDLLAAIDEEAARFEKRVERAGIEPGALVDSRKHRMAAVDHQLYRIRDLILPPPARLQVRENRPELSAEEVQSGH